MTEKHPLIRAYVNHDVCLVNPFRCKIAHKKASFEMLTDEEHQPWFTSDENEAILRCVPWTRRVSDRRTTRHAGRVDLLEFIRKNRKKIPFSNLTTITAATAFISDRISTIASGTMPSR